VLALAWLAQRGVQPRRSARRARLKAGVRKRAVTLLAWSMLVRLWIVTLSILLVGIVGDREDGLAAAVLAAILFTSRSPARRCAHVWRGPETP